MTEDDAFEEMLRPIRLERRAWTWIVIGFGFILVDVVLHISLPAMDGGLVDHGLNALTILCLAYALWLEWQFRRMTGTRS